MNNKVIILGAIANTGIEDGNQVFTKFLNENVKNIEVRRINYGPGPYMALDWQLIIDSASLIANIAAIAGTLWAAYEKFVAPIKKDNARVFVQFKNEEGKIVQFSIGSEYKDKKIFIETFTKKIESLNNDSNITTVEKEEKTTIQIK